MAQPTPAPIKGEHFDFGRHGALGTGDALENAAIGFRDGKIDYVGFARTVDRARYNRH